MNSDKKFQLRVIRNYSLICLAFIALSFIGLAFNEWILPITVTICSLLGEVIMLLLLKSNINTESGKGIFVVYLLIRYALMALGLVAAGFLVKYTMSDPINKKRYFIMIISALPYFATSIALSITKNKE